MSLDRKYVIASAVAAFVGWALLTDRFPSVRWIPYAFIAGLLAALPGLALLVVTHSRRVPIEHAQSPVHSAAALVFTAPETWEEEKAALEGRAEYRRPAIFPDAILFSKAVDGLLDWILRDFITSWYGSISKRQLFQHEIDRSIRSVLLSVTARLTELDVIEAGVSEALPLISMHLKDFYDAERLVRGRHLTNNVTESDELNMAIAGKYRNGQLHAVASLAHMETALPARDHLRKLIEKLLPSVLPAAMRSSRTVIVLLREILACAVLAPIVDIIVEPDTWNLMVVNFGGATLQDRKTVRKVRAALDEHAPLSSLKPARNSSFARLRPYDSERQFERFVRAIRHMNTLTDARRFRSEVISQLRRDSAVEGQDAAYLRRLETGKQLLDRRIAHLSATGPPPSDSLKTKSGDTTMRKRQASLREVIYDAAGLSYFMEYMDRQNSMKLVQFYLVVDGFRSPLEGDADEAPPSVATDPDRLDVGQMYNEYLKRRELNTPESTLRPVKHFLKADSRATTDDYIVARQAVLAFQTQIYNLMKDRDFENFKKSDLYYKWLAVDEVATVSAKRSSSLGPASSERAKPSDQTGANTRSAHFAPAPKETELRRAIFSATDLKSSLAMNPLITEKPRRSLDDLSTRPALFEDDVEDERMLQSVSSLKSYDSDGESAQQARDEAKAVTAMQAALDRIVGSHADDDSSFEERDVGNLADADWQPRVNEVPPRQSSLPDPTAERGKPNISSLGLVGVPSSRGVFVDDLFGAETKRFMEDEREDSEGLEESDSEKIQEAAPGDLGLTEAIDVLNAEVERLSAQRSVLDSLTAKAELTNNTAELRILRKSESSLQREIKRKEMQKQQYMAQESDNSLYGRADISIKSVMVGKEEDGHEFALYVIEVRRRAGDQMLAAEWVVTRRYSQFHELHKRLKARFPTVKDLDFPRRQALFTLQKDFLQKRRVTLERYLRSLLLVPAICRSRELRAFLSQSAIASNGVTGSQADARDFVTRIYNSVSDGMEDFLGNISVLDQLSVAGQNLISAATAQISGHAIDALDPAAQDRTTAREAEAELNAFEAKESEPFVKPICDLFLEVFELSKGNSWLRGRTLVVVLHQLLGGTIERKVREGARGALQDERMAGYVETLKNVIWPDGKMRAPAIPRTPLEKARTRKEAGLVLDVLVPDLAGSVVGKANAQAASRKLIAALNNPRLNTHLAFTLLDKIVGIVFPEMSGGS